MSKPYTQLLVHLVWATWERNPFITVDVEPVLREVLHAKGRELRLHVHAVGGMPDHVHMLVGFPAALAISEMVGNLKGASAYAVARCTGGSFKWQGGYGAFTVSKRNADRVVEYIQDQEVHHRARTIVEEYEVTEE